MTQIWDWTVIGAGPAGIAALGKLLDHGIPAEKIAWIDPHFKVGDLGQKWGAVPSNTSVELFLRFLNDCKSFNFKERTSKFHLETLHLKENCRLQYINEPLQWITDHLRKKVHAIEAFALSLNLFQNRWTIETATGAVYGKNVILAIGSDPKTLPLEGPEIIPLETALDPEKLRKSVDKEDTIAVFGSSHSAILSLANIVESNVKKIINFYRSPHKYAVHLDDWILFDDTGLKGFSAKWAHQYIDGQLPPNLDRICISNPEFEKSFKLCNKAVYAVGFQRRKFPILEQYGPIHYDDRTGIIAPRLFGIGIAFPQAKFNPIGQLNLRVGLWKFMDYLNAIVPIWLGDGR